MTIDLKNARVLVIGGGGFIGRHVLGALESAGATPMAMDVAAPPPELAAIPWIMGSTSDPALLATAASGCEAVIFLANSSLPNTANFDLAAEVGAHVQTSVKAAEICNDQKVKRFVFASSGGTVYGYESQKPIAETAHTEPRNAYGASKLAIENYLRLLRLMREMETVSLRISNPYGEGQRALRNQGFIAAALQHQRTGTIMPIWGDGTVERDFIHVQDVAHAFLRALTTDNPPNSVNVGSGEAVSLLSVLRQIEETTGAPVPVQFEPGRKIDVQRNVLDISLARKRLGWEPSIALRDGLARTAAWWQTQALPEPAAGGTDP